MCGIKIEERIFLPSGQQASCCSGLLGSGSGSTNVTTYDIREYQNGINAIKIKIN